MKVIYEPRGKAAEYADLAANLYRGCSHRCVYCYAPGILRMTKVNFHSNPQPRKNVLKCLKKDAVKFRNDKGNILLSFTSDPYQPIEATYFLTRQGIKILMSENIKVSILTKGGLLAVRDFDLLQQKSGNEFAVTLTTINEQIQKKWEPFAASPAERIETLKKAKECGIKTWVSLEPVIEPKEVFTIIEKTYKFVDLYKIGKLNYHKHAKSIDWKKFAADVIKLCEKKQVKYLLKKDLLNSEKK